MTNRTAVQAIAVATLLLAGLATLEVRLFFPHVKVAKNTQTVNHDYQPVKPTPQSTMGIKNAPHSSGGGTIKVG
jgi:hypothetical protein